MNPNPILSPHLPLIITTGEPAGIGPDIVLTSLLQSSQERLLPRAIILGDPVMLAERAKQLKLNSTITLLSSLDAPLPPDLPPHHIPVFPIHTATPVVAGELNPLNVPYVLQQLDTAMTACQNGYASAMVTAPLHKGIINQAGIPFSGHTEYLQEKLQAPHVVMLLANDGLRVALVTVHIPLRLVPEAISIERIISVTTLVQQGLIHDFGIKRPRLALCGLNPHAGEGGHIGDEEIHIIQPAITQLQAQGLHVEGPFPADTIFVPHHSQHYDAIIAMYHDQGLAAFKQASFGKGVNVTLGLPIIRVSVDHGTALGLAGSGQAESSSLYSACILGKKLAEYRKNHPERI
jgi:4-hydroxythreonine-4-phosphate dehydrogenase